MHAVGRPMRNNPVIVNSTTRLACYLERNFMTGNEHWLEPALWKMISVEELRRKLADGADVGAKGKRGETPLHIAVEWSDACVTRVLIESGAEVNAVDEIGVTPLHLAARKGKLEIVRVLLVAGADVNAQSKAAMRFDIGTGSDNDKTSALHLAAKGNEIEILRTLIETGADVNARARIGLTPLHYAAIWGSVETVRILLNSGSDAKSRDMHGLMPLAYASQAVRGVLETEAGDLPRVSCLAKGDRNIMLYWDDARPPSDVADVVEQWRIVCPAWKVKLFNQGTACQFIRDTCGEDIARLFLSCALPSMRADFFRVFWAISKGGIYSDVRYIPVREPAFFDPGKDLTVTRRPNGVINNSVFYSKKDCKELKMIAYEILRSVSQKKTGNMLEITGPILWRKTLWQRDTNTMEIVDWNDIFGKYLKNSNYSSCTREKKSHWTRLQKSVGIYRDPHEQL